MQSLIKVSVKYKTSPSFRTDRFAGESGQSVPISTMMPLWCMSHKQKKTFDRQLSALIS
jgi:hypothetical protein